MATRLISSESVTEGHPDKLCDQISDAILDAFLAQDPGARVAVETFATNGLIQIAGEVTTTGYVDVASIARKTILDIGYDDSSKSFDGRSCGVNVSISPQSPDIAQGVDNALEVRDGTDKDPLDAQGAGDQGIMFGYATDETSSFMPAPISLAHRLSSKLTEVRKRAGGSSILLPDGKTQVTLRYVDGIPVSIQTVLVSTQHVENFGLSEPYSRAGAQLDQEYLRGIIIGHVIRPAIAEYNAANPGKELTDDGNYIVNPTGKFVIGGPMGDAGLTGRKIIVDTYGGAARHGGGAFSGKDPSKVDRSAAYALRWVAKNVVAAGLAKRVEIQAAYAIGVARPVGTYVETFGTANYDEELIEEAIAAVFDLRPLAIIRDLELLTVPTYRRTAVGGHFGQDAELGFTWERTNRVEALQEFIASAQR